MGRPFIDYYISPLPPPRFPSDSGDSTPSSLPDLESNTSGEEPSLDPYSIDDRDMNYEVDMTTEVEDQPPSPVRTSEDPDSRSERDFAQRAPTPAISTHQQPRYDFRDTTRAQSGSFNPLPLGGVAPHRAPTPFPRAVQPPAALPDVIPASRSSAPPVDPIRPYMLAAPPSISPAGNNIIIIGDIIPDTLNAKLIYPLNQLRIMLTTWLIQLLVKLLPFKKCSRLYAVTPLPPLKITISSRLKAIVLALLILILLLLPTHVSREDPLFCRGGECKLPCLNTFPPVLSIALLMPSIYLSPQACFVPLLNGVDPRRWSLLRIILKPINSALHPFSGPF